MTTGTSAPGSPELLARLARGRDREAWSELVRRHAEGMRRTAYAVLGRADAADDAVQEALLHVRDAAGRFQPRGGDGEAEVRRWLNRIAANTALNLGRAATRQADRERTCAEARPMTTASEAHDQLIDREWRAQLLAALEQMPAAQRQAVVLRYFVGLDGAGLALELGCREGTARMRLNRALETLRGHLARAGIVASLAVLAQRLEACSAADAPGAAVDFTALIDADAVARLPSSAVFAAPGSSASAVFVAGSTLAAAAVIVTSIAWLPRPEPILPVAPPASAVADQASTAPAAKAVVADAAPTPPSAEAMIARGVAWLESHRRGDGTWDGPGDSLQTARTAFGCLALDAAGRLGSGDAGIARLADQARTGGMIGSNLYEHAYALIALSRARESGGSAALAPAIASAVRVLVEGPGPQGGWRYRPKGGDADASVTGTVLVALAEARAAGAQVDALVLERATAYLSACQGSAGNFAYMAESPADPGDEPPRSFGRCAAATNGLVALRVRPQGLKGCAWLQQLPDSIFSDSGTFSWYGHLHASAALRMWDPDGHRIWRGKLVRHLHDRQAADGSWSEPSLGPVIATSMAALILVRDGNCAPPRALASRSR